MLVPFAVLMSLARAEDAPAEEPPPEDDADEVLVITGARTEQKLSESVVPTEVVTKDEIEESGAKDAADVLETVPGVQVSRSFRGAGIEMQGLDSKYVLVLVDGKRVIGATDGVIDLSRIPVERIERIEVVKGAGSALYGSDAIAGVVNIITRKSEDPYSGQLDVSGGTRDTAGGGPLFDGSGVGGARRDVWGASVNAGWHQVPSHDLDVADAQTDGNAVKQLNVGANADVAPSGSTKLDAGLAYTRQDASGVDVEQAATFDRRNLTEEAGLDLGGQVLVGTLKLRGGLHGGLVREQDLSDQRGSDVEDAYEETGQQLGQLDGQADWWLGDGHLVSAGVEGAVEHMSSPRLSRDGGRQRFAFFAQDESRIGERRQLAVVQGVRVDADSWFGTYATPRVSLRWDPVEDVATRASAGTGFRAPTFKEMFLHFDHSSIGYVIVGNPELEPETSYNVSLGAEESPARGLRLRQDLYYNRIFNMITEGMPTAVGGGVEEYTYVNVASARTMGGELGVNWRVRRALELDVAYAYTNTLDEQADQPLNGRSPHRATFSVTGRQERLGVTGTVRGELVGPATFYDDDAVVTDPYANVKVRVEKNFYARRLRVYAAVDNLLDAGDALYVHLDPRTVYAGITVTHPGVAD